MSDLKFKYNESVSLLLDENYEWVDIIYTDGNGNQESWKDKNFPDEDIANACDFCTARRLPPDQRLEHYKYLQSERKRIMEEYDLTPLAALAKREELFDQEFTAGVESLTCLDSVCNIEQ